ncbi:MAG TPA: ATP-binding protein [Solirubrobacteraceae bacterium]|jgi:anti-sigma regulatory factor (Ser/Thr protein kinase)
MNGSARRAGTPRGEDDDSGGEAPMNAADDWSPPATSRGGAPRFQDSYPAVPESVAAVRGALHRFAQRSGVPRRTADAVALAASEAATNVVVHAYREADAPGKIEIAAAVAADELWVIVTDAGAGLRPRPDSPGLGLGLAIIAQIADGVDLVKPAAGGLELRMRFALGEAARS